ncbi:MAG TPA: acyl-CoA reductase [Cyclobacteriaceae bacterium]|nr:acyl-CoA reductase [Cyclobacteriaceae bacterium]HRJ82460.1 acyl-CoA reductase [Cyclobacteriaceae bacterium]
MTLDQRINAFTKLGLHLRNLPEDSLAQLATEASHENPWFTSISVRKAIQGIINYLDGEKLTNWVTTYPIEHSSPKNIALVMAGNIPLVGFHDLLCVLISGHNALVKLSSKDSKLNRYLIDRLIEMEPQFKNRITIQAEILKDFDAVIATGSDNSARLFDYYFRKVPNVIRRNRTSCAILMGNETQEDFKNLGHDVFDYFGLGCRNVSKLFVPAGYDFKNLLDSWQGFESIAHHHKYVNNYDYQKSILLVNQQPFLDTGFVLLQESDKLVSPIAVLYYEFYNSLDSMHSIIESNKSKLQCIVGKTEPAFVPFGQAQYPALWDYADGVDTMKFLTSLN